MTHDSRPSHRPEPSASADAVALSPDEGEHADFLRLLEATSAEREAILEEASRRSRRHAARLRELLSEVEGDVARIEAERHDHEVGRVVGGWRLERLIGRGGSSRVYRARREADGLVAALKLFDRSVAIRRIERELELLRRIDHPAIVRLVDDGVDPSTGSTFAVTELVPDASPVTEWALVHARTLSERLAIVARLRAAMSVAHAAGIVHCDLSPGNVLLTADGTLRIVDFGIARLVDRGATVTCAVPAGTPVCMAPEQVDPSFGPVGPWTDEYAAAVLAYRLLTGCAPYEIGESLVAAAQAITLVSPRPVRDREPAVPDDVARWIDGALVKQVARRRRLLGRTQGPAGSTALPTLGRAWRRGTFAASVAAATLAAGWFGAKRFVIERSSSGPRTEATVPTPAPTSTGQEMDMKASLAAGFVLAGAASSALAGDGGALQPEFAFQLPYSSEGSAGISGDLAVLGDQSIAGGGGAHLFVRNPSGWASAGVLTPPGSRARVGLGVSVSPEWVVIGDRGLNGDRGAVHVWRRKGNALAFHQTLTASDGSPGDGFGHATTLTETDLFVTSRLDDSWRGSVYRFSLDSSSAWQQRQKLQGAGDDAGDEFGWMLAARGDVMIATSWLAECGYGTPSGRLHVFERGPLGNFSEVYTAMDDMDGCSYFGTTAGLWGSTACLGVGEVGFSSFTPFLACFSSASGEWARSSNVDLLQVVLAAGTSRVAALLPDRTPVVLEGSPNAPVVGPLLVLPHWAEDIAIWNGIDDRRFALRVHNGLIIWDLVIDCDSDGVSDPDEIAAGSPDVNGNGVPDACECLGDLDSNGLVDAVDLAIVLAAWGDVGKPYPQADVDGSGSVDAIDLAVVLNEWGPCP